MDWVWFSAECEFVGQTAGAGKMRIMDEGAACVVQFAGQTPQLCSGGAWF